jgi:hypothetical protein
MAGSASETIGAVVNSSFGGIVSATVIRSKHNWCVLGSHTTFDWEYMQLYLFGVNSTAAILADLGVRTSGGSVQILASDLALAAYRGAGEGMSVYPLALHVPKSSQLVGRMSTTRSNVLLHMTAVGFGQGYMGAPGLSQAVGYGALINSGTGTLIDPGGSANAKGSWTVLGSLGLNVKAFLLTVGPAHKTSITNYTPFLLDVAVGPGTNSLTVIVSNYLFFASQQTVFECLNMAVSGLMPCDIKSGSGLWARAQSTNVTAADRTFDLIIHGVG